MYVGNLLYYFRLKEFRSSKPVADLSGIYALNNIMTLDLCELSPQIG